MSARLALVLCGCLVLPFAAARRQAQDYEESKYDDTVRSLCTPETGALAKPNPTITQMNATAVRVENVEDADVVYLINTYGTVISLSLGATPIILDWSVCWHKDYDPHMTSETIESVRAVAHYNGTGTACQETITNTSLETWYALVNAYEGNALDKDYVTSTPWNATDDELRTITDSMQPKPVISITERKATVNMARVAGKPVPFLYVKDSAGRVMLWEEFTVAEQESSEPYESGEFSIPLVSTSIEACAPLSIYKTQCNTIDLTEAIIEAVGVLSETPSLDASRGVYHLASSGSDKYTVTPHSTDHNCPATYILYAKKSGTDDTLGMSIGSALTIVLDEGTMSSGFDVHLACPIVDSTVSTLTVLSATLATDKAAAEAGNAADNPVSGDGGATAVQQCDGGKKEGEKWDCDKCDGGQCLCDFPQVICSGDMAAGEHISPEEAVGIAIAVVIIAVVTCGIAYFFYKKRMLSAPRKHKEIEVRETMPMAETDPSAPNTEQV